MARWVRKVWGLIGSRTFAIWTLFIMIAILTASAVLPNRFTVTEEEMARIIQEMPFLWKLSEHFSTPEIVTSPFFILLSFFLGLSTLICTIKRFRRLKKGDFSKRQAFSFSIKDSAGQHDRAAASVVSVLELRRWNLQKEKTGRGVLIIKAHKGSFGFWGSMIFHVSLIALFVTAVISAVSRFNSEIILTKGFDISTEDISLYSYISKESMAPAFVVNVKDLKLETKGRGITQLSGTMTVNSKEYDFAVNKPVTFQGYQFSPSRYGVAPEIVVKKGDQVIFDSIVNMRSLFMDDYIEIKEEGLKVIVRFFPDFYRDGEKFGTRTFEEKNPIFYVRVLRHGIEEGGVFIKKGESLTLSNFSISILEYSHWVAMELTRDVGTLAFIVCFFVGLIGLCIRFLSNERLVTCLVYPDGIFELRGWSRYYPAFLEKEITSIRDEVLRFNNV